MDGVFYCPSELSEPWGLELPPMQDCLWFHVVTSGTCTLEVDGVEHRLTAGDLAVIPHGLGHRGWGATEAPTPPVLDLPHEYHSEQYAVLRHGGGGDVTRLICGGVRVEQAAARRLIRTLPPILLLKTVGAPGFELLTATLQHMAQETKSPQPGGDAVVSRLCDIVVIHVIRAWLESDPMARSGWVGALRDPQIGPAIASIHEHPERDWTVAALADEVAMSRSAFAARFTELVGEPVMQYVTGWRMAVADALLREGRLNVAAVGEQVGYESEASFSRAFKRVTGSPPRDVKRATAA